MRRGRRKKLCYARAVLWEANASKSEQGSRYGVSLRKHFQLPSAIPKPLRLHPDSIQHREVKVRHRCTPRHLDMLSGLDCVAAFAGYQDWEIIMIVPVPIPEAAAIHDHA